MGTKIPQSMRAETGARSISGFKGPTFSRIIRVGVGLEERNHVEVSRRPHVYCSPLAIVSTVTYSSRLTMRLSLLLLSALPALVAARAILGVDLGSLYMKVALVQSGSPLEIVTNLHSKRKTEQMILFDQQQRFYGADASALLARKSHQTPSAMSVLLGRDEEHPVVQVRYNVAHHPCGGWSHCFTHSLLLHRSWPSDTFLFALVSMNPAPVSRSKWMAFPLHPKNLSPWS